MSEDEPQSYGLVLPFWIDTEGYTARDREMFTCGVEFEMIHQAILSRKGWDQCIHAENHARVRMMCAHYKVGHALFTTSKLQAWGWWQLFIAPDQEPANHGEAENAQ